MSTEPPTGGPPASGPPTGVPPSQPRQARTWLWVAAVVGSVVIAIIVAFVVLAGDDDDDGNETVQASPTPDAEATGAPGGDGGEDEDDDLFAALSEAVSGADSALNDIKVIYDVVQPQFEGQWTLARRPPSDSLVEIRRIDSESGMESIISVITTAPNGVARAEPQPNSSGLLPLPGQVVSYICTGFDGQGSCFVTDAAAAEAQSAPVDALNLIPQQLLQSGIAGVIRTSSDTIAGQSATCFSADLLDDFGDSEFCFSDNTGLLLRVRSEDTLIEATFVGPPTDEDFECCPFEVIELDGIDLDAIEIAPVLTPEVPAY